MDGCSQYKRNESNTENHSFIKLSNTQQFTYTSKMTQTIVAIAGATGMLGSAVTQSFIEALKQGRIQEVRILTTQNTEATEKLEKAGAKIFIVDYQDKPTISKALKGVSIVINTLKFFPFPDSAGRHQLLLESLVEAGVKVYLPSEFGDNKYSNRTKYDHMLFKIKRAHYAEAKKNGNLKVVRIWCNLIMEETFGAWVGLDGKNGVWNVIGEGNTKVAVTSKQDIGRFTLEAALLALKDPKSPDDFEFLSSSYTFREYAAILDSISGRKTKFNFIPVSEAEKKYSEVTEDILNLFGLMFEGGQLAVEEKDVNGNELLNPRESKWKIKRFEDYAKEVGGIPKPAM